MCIPNDGSSELLAECGAVRSVDGFVIVCMTYFS